MFIEPIEVPAATQPPLRTDAAALFAGLAVILLAAIVMALWWAFCAVVLGGGFVVKALRQAKATLSFAGTAVLGR